MCCANFKISLRATSTAARIHTIVPTIPPIRTMSTLFDYFCKSTKDYTPLNTALTKASSVNDSALPQTSQSGLDDAHDQNPVTAVYDATNIDMTTKIEVVKYAENNSVGRAVQKYPGLQRSTIVRWVAAVRDAREESLKNCPAGAAALEISYEHALRDRRARNGRNLPEAALKKAFDRFISAREEGAAVSTELLRQIVLSEVRAEAPQIVHSEDNPAGWFRCADTWLRQWKEDNQIRRRAVTTARRKEVDMEALRGKFLHRVAYVAKLWSIPAELSYHADETGVHLSPAANKTLDFVGERSVEVVGAGDKRQVTLMLGGTVAGDVLPPQVIFEGKTSRVLPPPLAGAVFTFTANHWASFDTTVQWLSAVLVPHALAKKASMGLPPDAPCMLIWDVWLHHKSQAMLDYIHTYYPWIKLVFVPASTTSQLQVADVSMNGPFKAHIRNSHSKHSLECLESTEPVSSSMSTMRELFSIWALAAIQHVRDIGAVEAGARRVGLASCFSEDMAFEAMVAHQQGDLWVSNSRNDMVAVNGNVQQCTSAADQAADSDDEHTHLVIPTVAMTVSEAASTAASSFTSGTKRRRHQSVGRCSHCRKKGHNRATCPIRAAQVAAAATDSLPGAASAPDTST